MFTWLQLNTNVRALASKKYLPGHTLNIRQQGKHDQKLKACSKIYKIMCGSALALDCINIQHVLCLELTLIDPHTARGKWEWKYVLITLLSKATVSGFRPPKPTSCNHIR